MLIGAQPSEDLFQKAGEIGVGMCSPITDHRGTMEYRCMMIEVLIKRMPESSVGSRKGLETSQVDHIVSRLNNHRRIFAAGRNFANVVPCMEKDV